MIRKIVKIDEDKCNGCGQCVPACVEGALKVIDGKARLVSDVYCDGLGACLGDCPEDAITIEEREAPEFDEEAVKEFLAAEGGEKAPETGKQASGCPGSAARSFACPGSAMKAFAAAAPARPADNLPVGEGARSESALSHWPLQLKLVPPFAPFLKGADILVCADCVPFAVGDFHKRYLEGRAVLVGCPKLDDVRYYVEKLKDILAEAEPASLTVLRMEVPCCGGIVAAALEARDAVRPELAVRVDTVGIRGAITSETVEGRSVAADESKAN